MKKTFDVGVLGGGPGGLAAAVYAARQGAQVVLVDPGPLGGTCVNRGCIPARSMGTTAKLFRQLQSRDGLGIQVEGKVAVDLTKVLARKQRILRKLNAALSQLMSRSQVTWVQGVGSLTGPNEVEVTTDQGKETLQAKSLILATGSIPGSFPGVQIDGKSVITSDEILDLEKLPASLVVIGAGVIGSEFASYFADMGTKVTLIEIEQRVLPSEEPAISEVFAKILTRKGAQILTTTQVQSVEPGATGAQVVLSDGKTIEAELALIASGRKPRLPHGCEKIGLKLEKGAVVVDKQLRTNVPSIFAIGDLLAGFQLAATAAHEGVVAAGNALGKKREVDYRAVPEVIYTEPEIGSVGFTASQAEAEGYSVTVSRVPFMGFPRAETLGETDGFIQVVSNKKDDELLGVQMIGPRATDLMGEVALALHQKMKLQDLVEVVHGHPTMHESVWEAAAQALDQSIYYQLKS